MKKILVAIILSLSFSLSMAANVDIVIGVPGIYMAQPYYPPSVIVEQRQYNHYYDEYRQRTSREQYWHEQRRWEERQRRNRHGHDRHNHRHWHRD